MSVWRKRRMKTGLTVSEVANYLDIDYNRYMLIDRGIVKMPSKYIDKFVNKNETMYWKREKVLETCKYTICTDIFIVFCKATKDDVRLSNVERQNTNKTRLSVIESEVEAFLNELDGEDYETEMTGALESVF